MELVIEPLGSRPASGEVEIVERKGLGHPDTICDAIAEHVCVRLCRYYFDRFGMILHHNVDKVLLCGGSARAAFGGGEVLEPIEIYLAGRATFEWRGVRIPVHDIAVEACREWLSLHLPDILERQVRIIPRMRQGSGDLTRLFERNSAVPLANDSSCGAGFAPLTDLERAVLGIERYLNSPDVKHAHPEIGADMKVMGVRRRLHMDFTIGCAFVSRFVSDVHDYSRKKEAVRTLALEAAHRATRVELDVTVNAADDTDAGNVFLTVTGTSAEAGDDGEVGRGNRTNGLITPYRFMTMEAAAGKNPVSHVGKLYNLVAARIAGAIAANVRGVSDAACVLVSQIGRPVDDPQVVDLRVALDRELHIEGIRETAKDIVRANLDGLGELREALLGERVTVY